MAFERRNKAKVKLLIGVLMCVAVVTAITMLRGGRGMRAGENSLSIISSKATSDETHVSALPAAAPLSAESQTTAVAPAISLSGKLAQELARIQAQTDLNQQARELQKAVDQIALADIPSALEALKASTRHSLDSEFRLLLVARWARSNGAAVSAWIEQNLLDSARQQALRTVGVTWVGNDRDAAVEWARHLTEAGERAVVLTSLAYEINRDDPSAASLFVAELPPGESRDDVVAHIAAAWAVSSPSKAMDWISGLSSEDLRQNAIAAVATTWAESDPVSAGTLAVRSLPAGKVQEDAVVAIVQRWSQQEPIQAAAWVTGFPEGPLRDTAVEELVKLWAHQNLQQAGKWLNDLAAGRSHDVAVGAYVGTIAPLFPKVAAEWVNDITDDTLRYSEIERLAEIWLSHDANSARSWIAEVTLPETRKARLLALKSQ